MPEKHHDSHEEREARHIAYANKAMKTKDGTVAMFFGLAALAVIAAAVAGMFFFG
ncbi:MAG: hypothetical protein KGI73_04905 [Patescibacteria group bacterium]|nr:hypothetical protein [Patescibacteria group bacterium]